MVFFEFEIFNVYAKGFSFYNGFSHCIILLLNKIVFAFISHTYTIFNTFISIRNLLENLFFSDVMYRHRSADNTNFAFSAS